MAEGASDDLEKLIYCTTNPLVDKVDQEALRKLVDAISKDMDGPSNAARLLGHKIQSPQEKESLNALEVTDLCINMCGLRFQAEIGKFRFLNEVIKMVSPKYYGDKTSQRVREKCVVCLYKWSRSLRHEPKILEAYSMLKKQGIVVADPVIMDAPRSPPPPRRTDSIFTEESKSKLLAKLLQSKNPEDLQAANRLIKNTVKMEEEKQEKVSLRHSQLETIANNVKLLGEMLACFSSETSSSDRDIIKELYENIETERPKIFKLASETEEKDTEGMAKILLANDEVVQVIAKYKAKVEPTLAVAAAADSAKRDPAANAGGEANPPTFGKPSDALLDLEAPSASGGANLQPVTGALFEKDMAALDIGTSSAPAVGAAASQAVSAAAAPSSSAQPDLFGNFSSSLQPQLKLDDSDILGVFGGAAPAAPAQLPQQPPKHNVGGIGVTPLTSAGTVPMFASSPTPQPAVSAPTPNGAIPDFSPLADPIVPVSTATAAKPAPVDTSSSRQQALAELDSFGKDLLQQLKPTEDIIKAPAPVPQKMSLNEMKTVGAGGSVPVTVQALTDVNVTLQSVQPGTAPPLTIYEKNNVKVVFHFCRNTPRADVCVIVVSTMSTNPTPLTSFVFQAAAPKTMKVKLQPSSATDLPAFNPILPPTAITQVLLLANPAQDKIRLKYKLSYMLSGSTHTDVGDVANVPEIF